MLEVFDLGPDDNHRRFLKAGQEAHLGLSTASVIACAVWVGASSASMRAICSKRSPAPHSRASRLGSSLFRSSDWISAKLCRQRFQCLHQSLRLITELPPLMAHLPHVVAVNLCGIQQLSDLASCWISCNLRVAASPRPCLCRPSAPDKSGTAEFASPIACGWLR